MIRPDEDTEDIREYLAATTALAGEMDSDTAIYIFDETQYNEMIEDTDHPIFVDLSENIRNFQLWMDVADGKGHGFREGFLVVSDELFLLYGIWRISAIMTNKK